MTDKLNILDQRVYTTEGASVGQSIGLLPLSETLQNDPTLMLSITNVNTTTEEMTEAINRRKTKSPLEDADARRDDDYRSLYYSVKGYTYNSDTAVRSAAELINDIYDQYGLNVTKEGYSQETAHIEALLMHLRTTEALAAIALLPGVTQGVANLTQSQAAFTTTYVSYESDKAEQDNYDSASVLKKELLDVINRQLIPYLQVMNTMNPDVYGEYTAQVAQIINDTNMIVRKRNNKSNDPVTE